MYELLAQLLLLFTTELVQTSPYYFCSVHILKNFAAAFELRNDHLPALVINPMGDRHEQGPFSNTAREVYQIKLRIVARSVDSYAYQVEALTGTPTNFNVHILSEQIRKVLYDNKKLTNDTFEMKPLFTARDVEVMYTEESGAFSIRDIDLEYTRLEGYTGMQNDQDSLQLSEIFNF